MEKVDENENCLRYAQQFKPYLRFDIGDIVYHKSDWSKKTRMVIDAVFPYSDDCDYRCEWLSSQKELNRDTFFDKGLQ